MLYGLAVAAAWLTSSIFTFIGHEHDSLASLLLDIAVPNDPLVLLVMVFFASGAARAKRSKLSDEEALELADEAEVRERETRAFAKWLWLGDKHKPGEK